MDKQRQRRFLTLLLVGVAVAAIVVLAAGLSEIELQPGRPLPRPNQDDSSLFGGGGASGRDKLFETLMMALYVCFLLLLPISIIYFIVSPEARRQVLRSLVLLLWILAAYLLIRTRPELFQALQRQAVGAARPGEVEIGAMDFVANAPQWAMWVMAIGLAVLIASSVVGVAWLVWRRQRKPESPLAKLAEEAQQALEALQSGADLQNTVMRCYFEMGRVLREQRGILREQAMTPREFERFLTEAGLPGEHVGQLTRLFEAVRYGAKVAGEREERQAIDCLTAIVQACRSAL